MKSNKRAWRRHHRARLIARARRTYVAPAGRDDPERLLDWARRNWNNLASCSCWMCGQPRKHFGPPIQEQRLWAASAEDRSFQPGGHTDPDIE